MNPDSTTPYAEDPDRYGAYSSYSDSPDAYGGDNSYPDSPAAYGGGSTPEDFCDDDNKSFFHKRKRSRKPPHEDKAVRYSSHQYRNQQEPGQDRGTESDCHGNIPAGSGYEDWEEDTDEP